MRERERNVVLERRDFEKEKYETMMMINILLFLNLFPKIQDEWESFHTRIYIYKKKCVCWEDWIIPTIEGCRKEDDPKEMRWKKGITDE